MAQSNLTTVLLASGGLDSTTLAYSLIAKGAVVIPLFINYGQHCATTEYETLMEVLPFACRRRVRIVNISDVYQGALSRLIREPDLWKEDMSGDPLYLPYRNLLLLTVGAAFAQSHNCNRLYAAFINSNHAKEIDCSAKFFTALGTIFTDYGGVRVQMPFRHMSKYRVARLALRLRVPVAKTFSCQAASRIPCGACPNCVDRLEALRAVQVKTNNRRSKK